MDKKKLIGTIIGVILFGALIAGATFAWLTFTANISVEYYAITPTFYYEFTGDHAITMLPILISDTAHAVPGLGIGGGGGPDEDDIDNNRAIRRKITVTNPSSNVGGDIYIALKHDTSDTYLVTSKSFDTQTSATAIKSVIKYAICKDNPCTGNFTSTYAVAGKDTSGIPGEFIYRDSSTRAVVGTTTDQLLWYEQLAPGESHDYYIYFWLDAERIINTQVGKTYSGHIYAYGTQRNVKLETVQ